MELEKFRNEIDRIDKEVIQLLNERVTMAGEIGKIKVQQGAEMYVPAREEEVFQKLENINQGPLTGKSIRKIYREIISASIALEKDLVICFLGPEATYTHQAALRNFGSSLRYKALNSIPDVFSEVERGDADYGVIPVENSTEGVVFHSLDMLVESDLKIVSQVYLDIEHCLISHSDFSEIKSVHSKDQALGQCRDWLHRNLPNVELVESSSTAKAVTLAAKDKSVAAIAGSLAGDLYRVPVQQKGIQDCSDNVTRFLIVAKKSSRALGDGQDKTSLVISVNDDVGELQNALLPFSKRGINLCKIESRPSRKKVWDYYFFVDVIGHYEDPIIQEAIQELKELCPFVKWLGSYPNC